MVLVAMIMVVLEVLVIHSTRYGFYRISALGFWSIFLSLQILGGFKFGYFFDQQVDQPWFSTREKISDLNNQTFNKQAEMQKISA